MIRLISPNDAKAVLELVNASGLFSEDDVREIKTRLDEYYLSSNNSLWIADIGQDLEGIAYCSQEPMTNGTWNLLMLLVHENCQGKGVGAALVQELQKLLRDQHMARLLMVETSGTDDFAGAQKFYNKCGFVEVAHIPDFYDAGDSKIIFTKSL